METGERIGIAAINGIAAVSEATKDASDTNPVVLMGGVDAIKIKKGEDVCLPFDTVISLEEVQVIDNTFLRCITELAPMRNIIKKQKDKKRNSNGEEKA